MLNLPYTATTIALLRNCRLSLGGDFVRCLPRRDATKSEKLAAIQLATREIAEEGVHLAWHEKFGDYLKVHRNTRAFAAICAMASWGGTMARSAAFKGKHRESRPETWLRLVQGNPAAIASWLDELRRQYRAASDDHQRATIVQQGQRLQTLHAEATGTRY